MTYCIHITTLVGGVSTQVVHVDTPWLDGVELTPGTRLDGSPYWRAWNPYPTKLMKAHAGTDRCDFHDRYGAACCPPEVTA